MPEIVLLVAINTIVSIIPAINPQKLNNAVKASIIILINLIAYPSSKLG